METNRSLSKQEQQQVKKTSKPLFADVLVRGHPDEIRGALMPYREKGFVSYRKVLEIPMHERIPALAVLPESRKALLIALSAVLQNAFSNLNLRLGMGGDQIVELADAIIETSSEDNLGLQDVLLFLGDLLAGKAGKIYDRMDMATFFELFEGYRQKRHDAMKGVRYEEDVQFRSLPVNDRFVSDATDKERQINREAMHDYLKQKLVEGEPKADDPL